MIYNSTLLKENMLKQQFICIIGPGVVGQAQGKVFTKYGFKTVFLGGSEEKTRKLKKEGYKAFHRDELFNGTYNFDFSILTVPTPTIDGKINLKALKSASIDLGKRLGSLKKKKYHVIVVKSTVPPGTTENVVIPAIEKYADVKVGKDFGVCMNPEYLREKTAFEDALNPWLIVIGQYDKKSGDHLALLYKQFKCPILRCSIKEAEMQKYVHNLFNSTKISFFNEMREIAKGWKLNAEKIFKFTALSAEGMFHPNYGTKDLGPYQGSCLPKDTQAFLQWVKRNDFKAPLLEAVVKLNNHLTKNNTHLKKQIGLEL